MDNDQNEVREMVVIDGVRYDPEEADKLGLDGDRVKAAVAGVGREHVSTAYKAKVDGDGNVVDLSESNAGNGVEDGEGEKNVASKPRRSGGSDKATR